MTKGTWSFLAAIWQQTSEATDPASMWYAGASHVTSCSLGWQPSELDAAPTAWAETFDWPRAAPLPGLRHKVSHHGCVAAR
jgi:hypothetical protein